MACSSHQLTMNALIEIMRWKSTIIDLAIIIIYPVDLAEISQTDVSILTEEQRLIFDRVYHCVDSALGEMLFIDARGAIGKTFLTKVILVKL